jgi:hypothetical protein
VAENTEPPEPPKPATFTAVFVGKAGAEIYANGKRVGKTPSAQLSGLTVGKSYKFTAKLAGHKPYAGEFTARKDESEVEVPFDLEEEEPAPVRPQPKQPVAQPEPPPKKEPAPKKEAKLGKFACSTKPAGAQIWVDGKNTGRETPVALGNPLMLPVGSRKIVFKLNGKATKAQPVTVTEDGVAKLVNIPIE